MALSATAASLIAAGISAAGSTAASVAGTRATTNLNIHNRRWQEDMFKKETDYNTEMWNKQNEYNTASAQRSRLEQAGLNPYLMMGGSDAGTASSVSSPSAGTPQTQAPDYSGVAQGIQNAAQIASNSFQSASQNELLRQQVEAQRMQNKYLEIIIQKNLKNLDADIEGKEQHRAYEKYLTDFGLASFNSDMTYKQYQNEYMKNMAEKTLQDSLVSQMNVGLLAKELEGFDVKRKAEIQQMVAATYAAYASGHLSYESAKTQIASRLLMSKQGNLLDKQAEYTYQQTEGQKTTNWINKKSANFQAARIMHEMNEARWRAVHTMNNSAPDNYFKANYDQRGGFIADSKNGILGAMDALHFFK